MRRAVLAALLVAVAVVVAAGPSSSATTPTPGSAGTDTSLPATDSKVTVSGRGRFSDLKVTVNQTKDLVNQAISVTWTGGTPTTTGNGATYESNFLQIFQCWGDDDGTAAENPGPPPEQCQQGASDGLPEGRKDGLTPTGSEARTRIISRRGRPDFDPTQGFLDEAKGLLWKPFRPVEGPTIDVQADYDFKPALGGGNFWLNDYFNIYTTNEIAAARTALNGTGAELFEASTGLESSGLGCGKRVQALPDGSKKAPTCWLVVVPRGSGADENAGSGLGGDKGVQTSPLTPAVWRNRIAIPLEFNAIDSSCPISADQRRLVGSELFSAAVSSWQPALCSLPGSRPYSYGSIGDSGARQQLLSDASGAPGLGVISRPFDPSTLDPLNPVVYAPLSLSGTVIGFNIERIPNIVTAPPEEELLRGVRVAELNLTPRLVAKLLTQSYRSQVEINGSKPDYEWSPKNPPHLRLDPDFLQFNPEFELLENSEKNLGGLLLTSKNSDVARQVWEWVLSDPEAKAWMDGQPDKWGMKVNPVYATTAAANSNGAAFDDPIPENYPKSDPHCYQGPPFGSQSIVPPPLCGLDYLPYTQSLRDAARLTRIATDGAKTTGDISALTADKYYKTDPPQTLGRRAILSMTDTASAAQYGVQTARLSRAGDNAPDRSFIAPDQTGLTAGAKAMASKSEPAVLEPNPSAGSGAYPLTALTYAAVAPLSLDAQARKDYASFIDYAAGPGQVPGPKFGQLPPGYAPLSPELRAQAAKGAATIRDLQPPPAGEVPAGGESGPSPPAASDTAGPIDPGNPPGEAPTPGAAPGAGPVPDAQKPSKPDGGLVDALLTPIEHLARSRFLLPSLVVIAVLAALGALEITRRPRRAGVPEGSLPTMQPDAQLAFTDSDGVPPNEMTPPGTTEELRR